MNAYLSNYDEIQAAKDYWSDMPNNSFAVITIRASAGSNAFLLAIKEAAAGRLELYYISSGVTKIYKKGYTGDWELVG